MLRLEETQFPKAEETAKRAAAYGCGDAPVGHVM